MLLLRVYTHLLHLLLLLGAPSATSHSLHTSIVEVQ